MDKSLIISCFLIAIASGIAEGRANAFPNNESPSTHSSTTISVEQAPSAKDSNETFEEFLYQFNKDYNFQKSRVQFPLRITTLIDFETNKSDTTYLQSAEYQKHKLTAPAIAPNALIIADAAFAPRSIIRLNTLPNIGKI